MPAFIDLTGQRFGRLTVTGRANIESKVRNYFWHCTCECGKQIDVVSWALRKGHTISCGCYQKKRASEAQATHRQSHKRLYNVWTSMKQRCYNPNQKYYKDYGGRGIKVCEEWRHDYQAFHDWAYTNGYDDKAPHGQCTIDRINNDGDYSPDNCRWVDIKTQQQNRRKRKRKDG